ncbi:probable ATP-dependent RNA helicase DHX34 [Leptopilina heterotoma]|uniref:probable ATP-dependent RNA helicase DHX34 n=1 Tax=Leptopilina heterotoma TaxID=63436 RepID=UPI001CA98DA9|nr:probable ATP-dependent RNA helicase DHX34 [Leptopilina heterotoma]
MHSSRDKNDHRTTKDFDDKDYNRHHKKHRHKAERDRQKYDNTYTREKDDDSFSFTKYRRELNSLLRVNDNLINNNDDFWKFVQKYECLEKQKDGKSQTFDLNTSNKFGLPSSYDIIHSFNFSLACEKQLFDRVGMSNSLTDERLEKFKNIIIMYLGFKQKEKFSKLKKLRNDQENLPVFKDRQKIVDSVKNERVVIIAGDTGCGKSTQIPQYLAMNGFVNVACTQPRRIACISLAKRVAFETLSENYNEVGYQIRFEKQRNQQTKITFITEGLLLRQISSETGASQYDVIVLDEIHERHLYGDFLLGITKCLIHQRPELKLVLMSATINIQLFHDYFTRENVKIIQVPGRLYPIQLLYRPMSSEERTFKNDRFNPSPYVQILQLIDQKYSSNEKGDLLIFLSGMSEITAVVEATKEYSLQKQNWIILPLHSTLSISEQDKVFGYSPDNVRKCIVSTNIAETSITIDGIRFVADSGKVKEMSYDPLCKMQRLKEFWISKASAEQRKGRAGRTGPGVCFRLYSEEEYTALEKFSTPEMQRVPLDSLLLQMVAMGLPDPRKFPFIESPPAKSIENSIVSLKEQEALTENEKLTSVGRTLARLPVDLCVGKMLIVGSIFHQVDPVLSLAAALSVQNPFTNKAYRDVECETSRKTLESDHGDPITILNAYRAWLEIKEESGMRQKYGNNKSKIWCKRRGLEEQRFYEITKLRAQFKDLLQDCNLQKNLSENTNLTSQERVLRHGELKLLKQIKRTYKQNEPRNRKQLKLDSSHIEIEDDSKETDEIDIKDVEFRMKNDLSQVQNLVTATTACSYKDLTMLKLILCSGLYPQFACADEYNYCKSMNEQLYHTKVKPYVGLHPLSFFGNHPQILQLEEPDIITIPGFKTSSPVSAKHQLLVYLSLLETTKPYLVNTFRMPAAQTLLLFSREIETNSTFSMIVCDSWLTLEFPVAETGQLLLLKANKLRQQWDFLLNQSLQDSPTIGDESQNTDVTETKLVKELVEYMHTTVPYTIKRLLPASLNSVYVGNENNNDNIDPNPFQPDFQCVPNEIKGGCRLTNRITYNCLMENDWSNKMMAEMCENIWKCLNCSVSGIFTVMQRLQHQVACTKQDKAEDSNIPIVPDIQKSNKIVYPCPQCNKTFYLRPIEILKHKKQHL